MSKLFSFPDTRSAYAQKFERLLAPQLMNLYRLAYRFCGKREDAEDLVQDLLIKLYTRQTSLEEIELLRPWLAKSLYRLYIDQFRCLHRSPLNFVAGEMDVDEQLAPIQEQPELEVQREQEQKVIESALNRLSEEHRALIILCDIEGFSMPEAQEVLDLAEGTVKSRLHRARARLKEMLKSKIDGTFSNL